MAVNPNFKQAVLDYGELYIAELTKQLILNDKKATGDLIDSLDCRVIETVDGLMLEILANPYLRYVDKGRKKGTLPNVLNIEKWIEQRGITPVSEKGKVITVEQLSWAIAKSIEKDGIPATNVTKKARASLLVNKEAINNVVNAARVDVKALIKEALKNLNDK